MYIYICIYIYIHVDFVTISFLFALLVIQFQWFRAIPGSTKPFKNPCGIPGDRLHVLLTEAS